MSKTALKIIEKALRIIKVLDANQPLQAIDRNAALDALNDVVLHLPAQYNHLWTQTQGVLLMTKGQSTYKLGASGDRAVNADALIATATTTTQTAGDSQLTLLIAAGVLDGMAIGVQLSDNSFQWSTVSGSPVGSVVTLSDALTGDVNTGATVYAYSDLIPRPQMISNAQFADRFNGSEIPLEEWSRDDYFSQPDKLTQGSASQYYYSPQLNHGLLYVWPTAYSSLNVLNFTYIRPINVTANNADNVDFPAEWYLPLAYKVAEMLCDEYYVTSTEQQLIKAKSDELMGTVLAFDNSGESIRIELFRW
jgi:hypothetical protein